jgi:hypothetical protein
MLAQHATKTAEMWDPQTGAWTQLANNATPRMYHSVALLLPDGRVLSAGGGRLSGAPDELNAEIFSPPYLFQGPRPTISSAPTELSYNTTFNVTSPDAASIAKVNLIDLQALTHDVDGNQHYQELSYTQSGNTLTVTSPLNSNYIPSGYYYLTIVSTSGVPSVSQIVHVGGTSGSSDTTPPAVSVTAPVSGATIAGTTTLTATATDNVGVSSVQFKVDGAAIGAPDTTTPYSVSWNSTTVGDGTHTITAVAADAAGNTTTSAGVSVTVANTVPDTTPPVISNVASSNVTLTGAKVTCRYPLWHHYDT